MDGGRTTKDYWNKKKDALFLHSREEISKNTPHPWLHKDSSKGSSGTRTPAAPRSAPAPVSYTARSPGAAEYQRRAKLAGTDRRRIRHVGTARRSATPRGGRGRAEAARTHPSSVSRVGHDNLANVNRHPPSQRPPGWEKSGGTAAGEGEVDGLAGRAVHFLETTPRRGVQLCPTQLGLAGTGPSEPIVPKPAPSPRLVPSISSLIGFTRPAFSYSSFIDSLGSCALSSLNRESFATVTSTLFGKAL